MSTPVQVSGLGALQSRLKALSTPSGLRPTLQAGAEQIQADARETLIRKGSGGLASSVQVIDVSQGDAIAFAIGTAEPAGQRLEFGTAKRPPSPWLVSLLHAHAPALKQAIQALFATAKRGPSASS